MESIWKDNSEYPKFESEILVEFRSKANRAPAEVVWHSTLGLWSRIENDYINMNLVKRWAYLNDILKIK